MQILDQSRTEKQPMKHQTNLYSTKYLFINVLTHTMSIDD